MKKLTIFLSAVIMILLVWSCGSGDTYKALIVDGQSEHNWQAATPVLAGILEETGLFTTEVATSPAKGEDMSSFSPKFSKYDVVILNYSGDSWSEKTEKAFVNYVNKGGGVVVYHGASMTFADWKEYNQIIGIGGWDGRNEESGPYVYYTRRTNELVRDTTAGPAGSHGAAQEFEMRTRIVDHPITKGLPARWVQASDELYQQLRGPAENLDILATAYADPRNKGTGREEPVLMTIKYGEGRVFHTTLGHAEENGGPAMQSTGFIVTLQRGAEWAASGNVTQEIPFDFPTAAGAVLRTGYAVLTLDEAFDKLTGYEIDKTTKNLTFIQNQIRLAAGDDVKIQDIEQRMIALLKNPAATIESKKIVMKELSWMGSENAVAAITELSSVPELQEMVDYALARLK